MNQVLLVTKLITSLRKFYVHLHGLVTLLQKYVSLKSYIWRKAYWQKIEEDLEHPADEIKKTKKQANTEELWIIFKDSLQQSMDKNIPSKQIKSNNKLP